MSSFHLNYSTFTGQAGNQIKTTKVMEECLLPSNKECISTEVSELKTDCEMLGLK